MSGILNPYISDAARALVAEKCPHIPPQAAELLAGWFTLIDECDERWQRRWYPDPATSTATQMVDSFNRMRPDRQERERRAYLDERELLVKGATDIMAAYPQPMVIMVPPQLRPE